MIVDILHVQIVLQVDHGTHPVKILHVVQDGLALLYGQCLVEQHSASVAGGHLGAVVGNQKTTVLVHLQLAGKTVQTGCGASGGDDQTDASLFGAQQSFLGLGSDLLFIVYHGAIYVHDDDFNTHDFRSFPICDRLPIAFIRYVSSFILAKIPDLVNETYGNDF